MEAASCSSFAAPPTLNGTEDPISDLQNFGYAWDSDRISDEEETDESDPEYLVGKRRLRYNTGKMKTRRTELQEQSNTKKKIKRAPKGLRCNIRKRKNRRMKPQEQSRTRKKIARALKGRRKQIRKKHVSDSPNSTLPVHCGPAKGVLYKEKMAAGVSEKCILSSDGNWFTLPEFEVEGKRGSWKSWKRSIYCNSLPLETLISKGDLPKPPRTYHRKKKREDMQQTQHKGSFLGSWKKNLQRRFQSRLPGSRTSTNTGEKVSTAAENDQHPQEGATVISLPSLSSSSPVQAVACDSSPERTTPSQSPTGPPSERNLLPQHMQPRVVLKPLGLPVGTGAGTNNKIPSSEPPSSLLETPKPVSRKTPWRLYPTRRPKSFTISPILGFNILRGQNRMEQIFRNTLGNQKSIQTKIRDIRDHLAGMQKQQEDLLKALNQIPQNDKYINMFDLEKKMENILQHQEMLQTSVLKILAALGVKES